MRAAHPEETPLVVDPFAGGGSIPLEALRIGCDAFASDLNPVACLINKVLLEDIPRRGPELADELRRVGAEVKKAAERELTEFYPSDTDSGRPIAYLWARTVRCEAPNCGADIPLMRSFWLCKKSERRRALRANVVRPSEGVPRVQFEIFAPMAEADVRGGTVSRAKATCICCGTTLAPDRLRAQIAVQRGGADVVFDEVNVRPQSGQLPIRISGAIMLAVVTLRDTEPGRHYRLPIDTDYYAVWSSQQRLKEVVAANRDGGLSAIPDEPTPSGGGSGAGRAFSIQKYGIMEWGDLFTARQKVSLAAHIRAINQAKSDMGTIELLSLTVSHLLDRNASQCQWRPDPYMETVEHVFSRQALSMMWDFAEAVPISESTGSFPHALKLFCKCLSMQQKQPSIGVTSILDAVHSSLGDEAASLFFTDPPYYDAIPYSDLSDFFFVWLKRTLPGHPLLRDPFDPANRLSPKLREAVQDETKKVDNAPKDRAWFEDTMAKAFAEGRRVLRDDGIGSVVFAHKTTEGWEALLGGLIRGGWTITGSWPISTEMISRLRARDSAALATSVHLVCRPRPGDATVGDWGTVLRELPRRVADWMNRLQAEGVRGADLVFACIGPALEVYSRYTKVVDAEEREIPLGGDPEAREAHQRGCLAYVWEVVGRAALEEVLGSAESKSRNRAAGALEEDARLTALFLWTLQATTQEAEPSSTADDEDEDADADDDNEDEAPSAQKKKKGLSLPFDVARRFAQPLGIHLDSWEGRCIEIEKGVVRLIPVLDRAQQLFGQDGANAVADRLEKHRAGPMQGFLPGMEPQEQGHRVPIKGRKQKGAANVSDESLHKHRGATTLDHVHAAMLLQSAGRANALQALLKAETERGPDFLRLANALSALYPQGTDEKRLVDAMLLAVRR